MRPEPDAAKAEAHFERALTVARQQQAKSLEPRAAMGMARLWRDQGKRDEARDLLAPVYGWFTEGFDTLDLREAKIARVSWPSLASLNPQACRSMWEWQGWTARRPLGKRQNCVVDHIRLAE